MIRGAARAVVPALALLLAARLDAADGTALLGFSAPSSAAETALESRFDALLSAADEREWMRRLSSAPNHVGSPHDRDNAVFLRDRLREWGWDAKIEEYSVLYPTPKELLVELTAPVAFRAKLQEPAIAGDATSTQTGDELPPYNIFGADGEARADLVYVNRGMPDDYAELERQGVSVAGRIVIVRYGGGWRGLKPKLAYEHGAVGCLIYSDPRDDGYGAGDVYPDGGYRPRDAVQRGSVGDITLYSGDPLTPGTGATAGASRLAPADAPVILKIPVLPISYGDAEPLLAALSGRVAPPEWRGGLPLTYHIGPGPARVHMKVLSDWRQRTLYDVIARLRGTVEPDRWIIRGNHHDAWVFGATDPMSGTVALLSEAKAIGQLYRGGWRPRRTLVYASWDGEESGLMGSTEWAEAHASELQAKAVLYVNSDMNGRGHLDAGGSHALQRLVSEAARDVTDPETRASVLARATAVRRVAARESGRGSAAAAEFSLSALGSGSDYTPFLQHLGIDSLNLGFTGEGDYGVYHSAYDSFDHFRRFVDPSFEYGVALAKLAGRIVLRAAQAELLPSQAGDFANSAGAYVEELHKLADASRNESREIDRLIDDGSYVLAADPLATRAPPVRAPEVPPLAFGPLDQALERLKRSAKAFDLSYESACAGDDGASRARRERLNAVLGTLEETLLYPRGLPGRPWYRHMLYAPGMRTGYGVKTMPGIREAIEEHRFDEAQQYVQVVAGALDAYAAALDRAISAH